MSWQYRYSSSKNNAKTFVVNQLSEDYPPNTLNWVKESRWTGPESVDIDDVDYSNYKNWRAHHQQNKVKKFETKISKGKMKPVVLVKTPKNKKYIVIDGHHRALAYRNLGRPLLAWIGYTDSENGPWDTFHAKQRFSKDPNSTKETN